MLETFGTNIAFFIPDNFMEDCVMYNPLFDKNTLLGGHVCELCSAVTTVTQFFPGSPKQGPLHNVVFSEPLLFKVMMSLCCSR